MVYQRRGHPRGRHCEIIRDDDGTVIGRVQVGKCMTPEEVDGWRALVHAAERLAWGDPAPLPLQPPTAS